EDGTLILIDGLSQISGEEQLEFATYGTKGTLMLKNWRDLFVGASGQPLKSVEPDGIELVSLVDEFVAAVTGQEDVVLY
ncbi:hypothetical protein, partial [Pseudomonas sp. 2822-17]|uniref:hypothetical protein n=1 Tax=Pseudomonas sp. 2822-17 TaxID=1712678 RepID=UPI001C45DAD4